MSKCANFISEIGEYFKENNTMRAMKTIMNITRMLNLSEKRNKGRPSMQEQDVLYQVAGLPYQGMRLSFHAMIRWFQVALHLQGLAVRIMNTTVERL